MGLGAFGSAKLPQETGHVGGQTGGSARFLHFVPCSRGRFAPHQLDDGNAVLLVLLPTDVMTTQTDHRHLLLGTPELPVEHVAISFGRSGGASGVRLGSST